ncbi:MAG: alpha/beta hydrolase, partial [Pseudomonadota bacterium]
MIAPPNQGSEVVDNLRDVPGFKVFNGPAGLQLGTDENSIPSQLGPVTFDLGVIAGTDTINPILSQYLPNPDDGKVSVESTKVEGMDDFLVFAHTHTFIMRSKQVIAQVIHFLQQGQFNHAAVE